MNGKAAVAKIARHHGQVLNCAYGHWWPLSLHTDGFVKIKVREHKGKVRITYRWAQTRAELENPAPGWIERMMLVLSAKKAKRNAKQFASSSQLALVLPCV